MWVSIVEVCYSWLAFIQQLKKITVTKNSISQDVTHPDNQILSKPRVCFSRTCEKGSETYIKRKESLPAGRSKKVWNYWPFFLKKMWCNMSCQVGQITKVTHWVLILHQSEYDTKSLPLSYSKSLIISLWHARILEQDYLMFTFLWLLPTTYSNPVISRGSLLLRGQGWGWLPK